VRRYRMRFQCVRSKSLEDPVDPPARGAEGPAPFECDSLLMQHAFRLATAASEHDCPVIILGECGTGKEMLARWIHRRSSRGGRPLIPVDCASLAPGLVESELFGHVKGAFTGATDNRQGLIESANGGTLLLDEIGELPLNMQIKFLRALQEHEIRPVGAASTKRVNVRVIAATNRDLEAMVNVGDFRLDLFFA
jgi:transcriptional regulator with GAF, ATPase, and Fis domain